MSGLKKVEESLRVTNEKSLLKESESDNIDSDYIQISRSLSIHVNIIAFIECIFEDFITIN